MQILKQGPNLLEQDLFKFSYGLYKCVASTANKIQSRRLMNLNV